MATPEHIHMVASMGANPAGGAANTALVDFDFAMSSGLTIPELGARIIGYLAGYGASYGAGSCYLAGISWRLSTVAGSIDLPFPTTEYAALRTVFPGLPNITSYLTSVGDGSLTPIGTSIQVREFTANPTRRGKGRHYLPFVGADFINSSGQLTGTAVAGVNDNYGALFLGQTIGGASVAAAGVSVVSQADEAVRPIVSVATIATCSNLRTRRR